MNLEKKIALVCASNQNRSVEAHALFLSKGLKKKRNYNNLILLCRNKKCLFFWYIWKM